jgi:hypothetical protein
MVLGKRLFSSTFEFIFIDFAGVLVVKCQHSSNIRDPCRTEREKEVLSRTLFDCDLIPCETETAALCLVKDRCDSPLFLRVIYDRDFLGNLTSCRHLEFKLSFDFLRDCIYLEFIKSNVSTVKRFQDHKARIGSWLCWINSHLKLI